MKIGRKNITTTGEIGPRQNLRGTCDDRQQPNASAKHATLQDHRCRLPIDTRPDRYV